MKVNHDYLNNRKKTLETTRAELKTYFIGIDTIIDDLMDYIQVWYLMPELLSRPVIVNLWGMTGVGKTDLIRRMVRCLDFQDRFLEIELSNIDNTSYATSVSGILTSNQMNDSKPSILLFDEIQRFNTLDTDGKPMLQSKFTDFWELLSDGKLSKKQKDDLDSYLLTYTYNRKSIQKRKLSGEKDLDENPTLSYWEAENLFNILGIEKDVEKMTDMTEQDMVNLINKEKTVKRIHEPIDHSKTLIIVSGNLDEAFNIANQISESDIDADIFHSFTTKVNLVDIKNALSKKFRPEQVARFGNIHLIYTSLRKVDFENLIEREIARVIQSIKTKFDIAVTIDATINALIYSNGVFPVQGVRPVFSSVIDILETNLSNYLFTAITTNKKQINIRYDALNKEIICAIDKTKVTTKFVGRIDKIRQSNIENTVANISVHEAGHAVAYVVLFNLAPLQLKSKIASSYASGFTFPHQIHETRRNIVHKIKILLAGGIAEELVFGKENASIGRSGDRQEVTVLAADYVRRYGFDTEFQANYSLEGPYSMDKFETDMDIEKMISNLVAETYQLLSEHKQFLLAVALQLKVKGSLESQEIVAIAQSFGHQVQLKDEGYLETPNYEALLNNR